MKDRNAEKEKQLYILKWHDYRMLTPDTATLAFLNEFAKALTEFNESIGRTRYFAFLKNITSFEPSWLRSKKKQFWNTMQELRQWADGNGFDYADFWSWGFESLNNSGFHVTYVNAFLNIKIKLKIKDRKMEYDRHYTKRSSNPYFRAENFVGTVFQTDYYDYLIHKARNPNHEIMRQTLDTLVEAGELHPEYLSKCLIDRAEQRAVNA